MSVERIKYLTDFDVNSGVVEAYTESYSEAPAMALETTTHIIKDVTSLDNFAFVGYVRFSDIDDGKVRFILGTTVAGVGKAIDLLFTAAGWKVQYVDITTFDGASTAVNQEVDFKRRAFEFYSTRWYKIDAHMVGTDMVVNFDHKQAISISNFAPAGTYWGLAGIDTNNPVYVSDINLYNNQILHGNVNINGTQQGVEGRVRMYDQTFYTVYKTVQCDTAGNYMIFLEDDALALNKYFMIGYVDDRPDIQPRGVANITL